MRTESEAAPSARRQVTREKLQDAAIEVFAEEGLQGASVEAVCARAGFTRGAFYSNFESKEQLFLALLEREFDRRARDLEEKALVLEPMLRDRASHIDPPEAAHYVAEFFLPPSDATAWFVLETELLLLALRDPAIAPEHHRSITRFYAAVSGVVERIIAAAGRQFVIPIEHAVALLGEAYQLALRTSALAGPGAPGGLEDLGDRVTELLFALTEVAEV